MGAPVEAPGRQLTQVRLGTRMSGVLGAVRAPSCAGIPTAVGFSETTACALGNRCSIRLSYGVVTADGTNGRYPPAPRELGTSSRFASAAWHSLTPSLGRVRLVPWLSYGVVWGG
jgi:hypothetical protein